MEGHSDPLFRCRQQLGTLGVAFEGFKYLQPCLEQYSCLCVIYQMQYTQAAIIFSNISSSTSQKPHALGSPLPGGRGSRITGIGVCELPVSPNYDFLESIVGGEDQWVAGKIALCFCLGLSRFRTSAALYSVIICTI